MKVRLSLFLLATIVITAAIIGFGVSQLAQDLYIRLRDQRIYQTHQELQNKFHSFELFLKDLEKEMDQRLGSILPQIAERVRIDPAQWSSQALSHLASEFSVNDIYLIGPDLVIFSTTFAPDLGLNLGQLSQELKSRLTALIGSGRPEIDRMSMSSRTGLIKKYGYYSPQSSSLLVEASINMWEGAETFGSEAQKRFFLKEFFQSLVDSSDILLDLDLYIADDMAQWSILHEGVAMDASVVKQLLQRKYLEIRTADRLTVYTQLPRLDDISGFRYYSKTVFNTSIPEGFQQGITLRTIALTLVAAILAFLLVDRVIFRWLVVRIGTIDIGIQRMAQGHLDASIPVDGIDELSRIAKAINNLARQVLNREEQLQHAKGNLEQQVEQRTHELRQSMTDLAERERSYRYLVQHARSLIVRWQPDGTITFFNEFAQEFFGYPQQTILGRSIFDSIVPQLETSGRELHQHLQRMLLDPESFTYHENENLCSNGRRVWVAWANRMLRGPDGQPEEILSIGTDITHLRQVYHELIQARDQANAANRAKSEFLAIMSHEIRTPMNAILGMAELLFDTDLNDEQKNYVRIFSSAGNTLLVLINDILDLSKIEADRLVLEKVTVNLTELVAEITFTLSVRARDKGLELSVVIDSDINPVRLGDPARLRQILINLVGNAIKFTHQGSVRLLISEPSHGWIRLVVEDTGIGMAPEQQELIFEAFRQGDNSVTRHYGGTGLGLTICRRLAELMGGTITVDSEVGVGSRFIFTLPMEQVNLPAPHPVADDLPQHQDGILSEPASRPLNILMAEDSPDNVLLFKSYLKREQHRITVVDNGHEAVLRVQDEPFDLVIMDVQMPVMDGLQATRAIRAWEAKSGRPPLPILALTAHAMKEDDLKSRAAGCTEHLTKPIRKKAFLAAIDRLAHKPAVTDGLDQL
ncbi:MAG: response regulator [Magnetococcales bacterium]|nr:response regulator [Magnetococcales bacterium]